MFFRKKAKKVGGEEKRSAGKNMIKSTKIVSEPTRYIKRGGKIVAVLTESIAIFKYFEEISKIPRGSFHEEKISNYLVEFAKKNKLKYFQDDMKNVFLVLRARCAGS